MPHEKHGEETKTIANERYDVLKNKSGEESSSITQDFKEVKQMKMINNSAKNDSNSDVFLKIIHYKNRNIVEN